MSGLLILFFFLSGAVSLVYEVLWVRDISIFTGAGSFSISIILTIFMAGLALGSVIAGRLADRVKSRGTLLLAYGIMEILIGLYAIISPFLFTVSRPLYAAIYQKMSGSFIANSLASSWITFLLLIIPTALMGATLPVLCRWYISSMSKRGSKTGLLYGMNTLGAAVGALSAWFWLIHQFGMQGTRLLAAAINITIGLICLGLFLYGRKKEQAPLQVESEKAVPFNCVLTVLLFTSGFCAMAYEVIWTKLLALLIGPTTYSFTIILFCFITGLGLGSIIFGWLADRVKSPFRLLFITQLAAPLFVLFASQILGNGQLFFAKIIYAYSERFLMMEAVIITVMFLFFLPATLCLGAVFPLANRLRITDTASAGKVTAANYFANTIGACSGSLCAGFLLVPMLGKAMSISLLTILQVGVACLLFLWVARKTDDSILNPSGKIQGKKLCAVILSGAAIVVCAFFLPRWDPASFTRARYQRFSEFQAVLDETSYSDALWKGGKLLKHEDEGEELLYLKDGIGGHVSINRSVDSLGMTNIILVTSGKMDASTVVDIKTQVLSGHLPMMFHKKPDDVMVVGLASGMTAGEVLNYPVKNLDVLEISPEIVEACKFFAPWNNGVLTDDRVNIITQDARAHLVLTDKMYDVIISEPSNCWLAGMANLFSVEFFERARARLNKDGVFLMWACSYQMQWDDFRMITRTVNKVFPNSRLFRTGLTGPDYVILCFADDLAEPDFELAGRMLNNAAGSGYFKLTDPDLLCVLSVADDLDVFSGKGLLHTDDYPYLEYYASRRVGYWQGGLNKKILGNANKSELTEKKLEKLSSVDKQIELAAFMTSLNVRPFGLVDKPSATKEQLEQYADIVRAYSGSNIGMDYFGIRDVADRRLYASVHRTKILERLKILTKQNVEKVRLGRAFHDLANTYLVQGKYSDSALCYKKALEYIPDNMSSIYLLAISYQNDGDYASAAKMYEQLIEKGGDTERVRQKLEDCRRALL